MSNSKDDLAQTQTHGENIKYLFLAQRSRPYRGQEYMWYIVPRWYTHVLNIVWLSQRIKKQWPEHSAMSKPLFIWPWCQRSTSYKDNEWMQHDDTHMCQKLLVRSKTCQKPNKFDLEDTCQRRIGILNVRNISLRGDTPICQIWYGNVKAKKKKCYEPDTKTCQNPYNSDLEVKGQCHVGIKNVRDTSSHGDTSIWCKFSIIHIKSVKKFYTEIELRRTLCFFLHVFDYEVYIRVYIFRLPTSPARTF